ncbi:hypothetical protein ADU59_29000 [Pararhizobium polonicum]|uniref:DUF4304 domain-containing protein n=1 Tax=Pararhizobium polonicum TaxID=1612624 RepID=A0A1C7NSP8_9HYPH|nr:DUF4304 domain-containing protein [Pararhizobium polonicum]OBZ92028.1 hypothetical protein ADU59_29000 [Pararhizobium polonicum]
MQEKLSLESIIATHGAPALRKLGFTGSGKTFRRLVDDMMWVINFQGNRHGGSFAVNLGLHPLAIPDVLGAPVDSKTFTEPLCEFRRRLSPSGIDYWWHYTDRSSLEIAVMDATRLYETVGHTFFEKHTDQNAPLRTLTIEEFTAGHHELEDFSTTEVRTARAISLMRLAANRSNEALHFAEFALSNVGGASSLKIELEEIVARIHSTAN